MERKNKHLIVRITEAQFKNLADILVEEEKTKSELIREILKKYIEKKHKDIEKLKKQSNEKSPF